MRGSQVVCNQLGIADEHLQPAQVHAVPQTLYYKQSPEAVSHRFGLHVCESFAANRNK